MPSIRITCIGDGSIIPSCGGLIGVTASKFIFSQNSWPTLDVSNRRGTPPFRWLLVFRGGGGAFRITGPTSLCQGAHTAGGCICLAHGCGETCQFVHVNRGSRVSWPCYVTTLHEQGTENLRVSHVRAGGNDDRHHVLCRSFIVAAWPRTCSYGMLTNVVHVVATTMSES